MLAVCGGIWATIQFVFNSAATGLDDEERAACGVEYSDATFTAVTIAVGIAAAAAIRLALGRRPRAALTVLTIEAAFVVVWFVLGGDRAAGCATE